MHSAGPESSQGPGSFNEGALLLEWRILGSRAGKGLQRLLGVVRNRERTCSLRESLVGDHPPNSLFLSAQSGLGLISTQLEDTLFGHEAGME